MSQRFMLYTLDDGEWHAITEIAEELQWSMQKVVEVAKYLAQGRLIHYDEEKRKVKLQPWVKQYPRGEWTKPGKRSAGTVIIPQDGSVTLQETAIHNCLDTEVELNFIVIDGKIVELLINKSK